MRTNIRRLTAEQLRQLSAKSGISYDMLRHYARGRRGIKSLTAINIEKAARKIGLDLRREDLNSGCARCEFARSCRKNMREPTEKPAK